MRSLSFSLVFWIGLLVALAAGQLFPSELLAQSKKVTTPAVLPPDEPASFLFAGLGGFIPGSNSYRLNFSNSLVGLPIEVNGGLMFPVSADLYVPVTFRYDRRDANFVTGMSVDVVSFEPGIRYFFQHEQAKEIRIFGGAELVIADASAEGIYDVTDSAGNLTGTATAERDYYNIGLGVDVGLTYPLTPTTALDADAHLAVFFANAVADGGLGNIGGVSLSVAYRFGF